MKNYVCKKHYCPFSAVLKGEKEYSKCPICTAYELNAYMKHPPPPAIIDLSIIV